MAIVALAFSCAGEAERSEDSAQVAPATDMTSQQRSMRGPAGEYVSEDSLPYIRYAVDGQVSLNDRCPVRNVRLNLRLDPLYVNGRPIGFC